MEITTTTPVGGRYAAFSEVRVPAPVFAPRFTGAVRLRALGGFISAPSGPPL